MGYKDLVKQKEKRKEYYEKNKEKLKEKQEEYDAKNKEKKKEYDAKRREDLKQHAYDSITFGEIIDTHKWDLWCNNMKCFSKKYHPYSENFTNNVIFEMMLQGCFYCGDIAITIDRIDSTLEHTIGNCVGCCHGCNMSKGAADPYTFIRKAYYRVCGEYINDDNDIWFVNTAKPKMCEYKYKANKKGILFDLTKEHFDELIKGNCAYCRRSPTTWFGVDREVPSKGYVIENVVSCCFDCNVDKLEDDVENMMVRNKRIVDRVISGELVIPKCDKVILHKSHKTI